MVTIIVKDNETDQEMILRVSIDSEETATVNVKFNPPLDKKKKEYPGLWDIMASRVMNVIKED